MKIILKRIRQGRRDEKRTDRGKIRNSTTRICKRERSSIEDKDS